jgi:hypothetical protein
VYFFLLYFSTYTPLESALQGGTYNSAIHYSNPERYYMETFPDDLGYDRIITQKSGFASCRNLIQQKRSLHSFPDSALDNLIDKLCHLSKQSLFPQYNAVKALSIPPNPRSSPVINFPSLLQVLSILQARIPPKFHHHLPFG